jgi:hypothetical protein
MFASVFEDSAIGNPDEDRGFEGDGGRSRGRGGSHYEGKEIELGVVANG